MIGSRIGNYRIEREIPGGGMGRVFEATQLTLNRTVAIKVLRQELAESDDQVARFRREADTLARLDHESIVRIFDVVEHEDQHLIVMEFVGGPPLGDLLARSGPFPPAFARDVAADIAGALAAAHGQGIIHRDIKPGNILFTTRGRPKLADFGIARIVDAATGTQSQLVGTPFYMSPEQVRGDVLTPVSDVYSLGVVLYEMLSGRVPFTAETPIGVAMKHVQEPPPALQTFSPDLPVDLCRLIERALDKQPGHRHADAESFQEALQRLELGIEPGRALRRLFPGLASGDGSLACLTCGTALKPGFLTCPRCGQPAGAPSSPSGSVAGAPVPGAAGTAIAHGGRPVAAKPGHLPHRWSAVAQGLPERILAAVGSARGSRTRAGAGPLGRPGAVTLTAAAFAALAATGVAIVSLGSPTTGVADSMLPDSAVVAHGPVIALDAVPAVPTPLSGGLPMSPGRTGDGELFPPQRMPVVPADPGPDPESARRPEPRAPAQPRGGMPRPEPPPEPDARPRPDAPPVEPAKPSPAPTPEPEVTPRFDEASAAREIHAVIDRQRRATESGNLDLLLQDLGSSLHRDATRNFRGMHRDASGVSSEITNRVIRFSDPDNAQVSFHAVITATRRSDRQRITVADVIVVWRLTRTDGRWLIVSAS